MQVLSERTRVGEGAPNPTTTSDVSGRVTESALAVATESMPGSAGEIIVLRVDGEVDLCTLPILRAGLDDSLDQHPGQLVIDLARMTFCSVRGLDLLTMTGRIAAGNPTGYAVSGASPWLERIWMLCWDGDLPVRYPSVETALTAIRQSSTPPYNSPRADHSATVQQLTIKPPELDR